MDLFSSSDTNLLPLDGKLFYFSNCFSKIESDFNFNQFLKTSYYDTSHDNRSLTWNHDATTLWPFLKL